MGSFTDLVALIILKSGHLTWHHIDRSAPKRVSEITWMGQGYTIDESLAHIAKGWYPWIVFNWRNPFAIVQYYAVQGQRRVGVLVYREPWPHTDTPMAPIHETASGDDAFEREEMTPALVKAHILSPLYRNYQKGLARMGSQSQRMIIYILIGIIGILILFYLRIVGMI